jgi:phosphofructokinase-like protein
MGKRRIAVLTGGGDCPGLNPALKWVVQAAADDRIQTEAGVEFEVIGIRNGWKGLVNIDPNNLARDASIANGFEIPHGMILTPAIVRSWDRYGGTFLGSSRTNPYNPKNDQSKKVIENIEKLGLEALIAIGGDDTLSVAQKLSAAGVNVVGIPKTIDKDLPGTDYTLGFESAINVILESVDRLRTTAGSHGRTFVVEVMGRNAGWLALIGGESSGASMILIPEHEFTFDKVNSLVKDMVKRGARYNIIVAAEGAKPEGGKEAIKKATADAFGHEALGGIGDTIAQEINDATGVDTRCVVLSHLQRGGAPCAYDRRMGRYYGIAAIDLVVKRQFGRMVSLQQGKITSVPIKEATGKLYRVDVATEYDTERYNGRRKILR